MTVLDHSQDVSTDIRVLLNYGICQRQDNEGLVTYMGSFHNAVLEELIMI